MVCVTMLDQELWSVVLVRSNFISIWIHPPLLHPSTFLSIGVPDYYTNDIVSLNLINQWLSFIKHAAPYQLHVLTTLEGSVQYGENVRAAEGGAGMMKTNYFLLLLHCDNTPTIFITRHFLTIVELGHGGNVLGSHVDHELWWRQIQSQYICTPEVIQANILQST